jgi:hypothetical protein
MSHNNFHANDPCPSELWTLGHFWVPFFDEPERNHYYHCIHTLRKPLTPTLPHSSTDSPKSRRHV